jgi:serine/threonine-protein kinase
VRKYDPSAKDTVIGETPKAGTKVREGSIVTLVVSDGPAPIKMPRLVGLTLDKARDIAARDGFTINVSERATSSNIPPNVIASQDVPAGSTVAADHSVTVNVVVSSGGGLAQVPNVVGADYVTATQQIQQSGFSVLTEYALKPQSSDNGQVIDEDPGAGSPAEKGTSVKVTLSVPGEVPDTNGLTLDDAKKVLLNAGYTLGNVTPTTEGADGKVVRTDPYVGTQLRPGSPVNIYVNSASAQPPTR